MSPLSLSFRVYLLFSVHYTPPCYTVEHLVCWDQVFCHYNKLMFWTSKCVLYAECPLSKVLLHSAGCRSRSCRGPASHPFLPPPPITILTPSHTPSPTPSHPHTLPPPPIPTSLRVPLCRRMEDTLISLLLILVAVKALVVIMGPAPFITQVYNIQGHILLELMHFGEQLKESHCKRKLRRFVKNLSISDGVVATFIVRYVIQKLLEFELAVLHR